MDDATKNLVANLRSRPPWAGGVMLAVGERDLLLAYLDGEPSRIAKLISAAHERLDEFGRGKTLVEGIAAMRERLLELRAERDALKAQVEARAIERERLAAALREAYDDGDSLAPAEFLRVLDERRERARAVLAKYPEGR